MNDKNKLTNEVLKTGRRFSVAYLDMLLAGKRNASYQLAKVLSETTDSQVDIWCDPLLVGKRVVVFELYKKFNKALPAAEEKAVCPG